MRPASSRTPRPALDLGVALVQELPAADALVAGRLVRLSPLELQERREDAVTHWLVFPSELAEWPPLAALRRWMRDEMDMSRAALAALAALA